MATKTKATPKCPYCSGTKRCCPASTNSWYCTRDIGHTGDHVTCGSTHDRHRWPQQGQSTDADAELCDCETITVEEGTLRVKAELDRMEPRDLKEALKIYGEMCYQQGVKYGVQEEHKRLIEDSEALGELINQADFQAIATRLPLDTEFVGMIKVK